MLCLLENSSIVLQIAPARTTFCPAQRNVQFQIYFHTFVGARLYGNRAEVWKRSFPAGLRN